MLILICDDMNEDALQLKNIIDESGFNSRIVIFNTGVDALDFLSSSKIPDICFLDILMPKMDGVSLAEQMREKGYRGHIVFLTTTNDYAAQSYKVKAFSYLLKPPDRNEVVRLIRELDISLRAADTSGILVKTKKLSKFILFKDISHIEVINHKIYYRLTNGDEIEESARISEIVLRLQVDRRFAQCHRSFVVNMEEVYKIQDNKAIMNNGVKIPISRHFADFTSVYIEHLLGEK